jgi:photosystem II PsbZ protein
MISAHPLSDSLLFREKLRRSHLFCAGLIGGFGMSFIFQVFLLALVVMSFAMVVGVPVAYASPQNWEQSKRLIWLGSFVWIGLVVAVAALNFLVV